MSKPFIFRASCGRWYVRVHWLHYDIGPFPAWECAYRYATKGK